MIAWLKNLPGMKWSAREDTPDTHAAKAGTPSMGGLGILFSATMVYIAVVSIAFALAQLVRANVISLPSRSPNFIILFHRGFSNLLLWLALLPIVTLGHMALGFVDDWSKAKGHGGLRARTKLFGQLGLAGAFLLAAYWLVSNQDSGVFNFIPHGATGWFLVAQKDLYLRIAVALLLIIVIVGTCNAVNITDGIDGLAAGLCVQVGLSLWMVDGNFYHVKQWTDAWWLALAGACAGFLIFNKHKAQVFMGDTGSLALGAALGAAAIMTRTVFLLPFIGFVFFVEMFSVVLQVAYFKYTRRTSGEGKRIFRRAPLHHHFELGGWNEKRVVLTFWTVNLVATAIGLALWSAGILPRFP